MGIYGCHVVAPHSIHALAAIGFRLRKLRKLPELWYDLRTDTQINIKIISNSLLLGLWSNSKWLGSGRKLCLNSMIYFRLGTKHQRTLHLLDKSILTETPGAWLFRPPLRLGGWWGNYPNYPQQTSSATHHSLWQLPIFLEWPRAAVALPASRLGPRAMDDEILEDCSGNFWVARVATVCRHLADLGCSIRGTEPLNIVWGWFEDGLMVWWCLMIFDGFWWFEVERRSTTSLVAGFKDTSSCSAAQQQSGCGKFTIQHGPVKRCKKKATWTCFDQKILETIHVPGLAYMWECPMFRCVQVFWEIICSAICVRIELLAVAFSTIRFQVRLKREKFLLRAQIRPELRIGERWARQEEESPLCQTGSNMTWPFTNASTTTVRLLFLMIPK